MTRDRLILTPEHVQIRLQPAGPGSRFVAVITDFAIVVAVSSTLASLLMMVLPPGLGFPIWATANFVLTWGYHLYFETRHEGRSPGKRAAGLRVVDGRGLPISLDQSFVRNVVRVLDAAPIFYGLGGFVCQLDRHRRRLGDIAADTLVIQESRTFEHGAQLARSREYNSLRVPRVLRLMRHRVSLPEREFLLSVTLRADGLEPRARFDLMEEIGRHYRAKLEIDDARLSGESLVKGLTAILFWDRRTQRR